jgi:hypothetical protein
MPKYCFVPLFIVSSLLLPFLCQSISEIAPIKESSASVLEWFNRGLTVSWLGMPAACRHPMRDESALIHHKDTEKEPQQ